MDPNVLAADLSSLSEEDKAKISSIIDNFQIRDSCNCSIKAQYVRCKCEEGNKIESLRTYNSLAERCFSDCVNSFYRKSLGKQEEDCVTRCTKKFLKLSMRVSMRFAELNPDASTQ